MESFLFCESCEVLFYLLVLRRINMRRILVDGLSGFFRTAVVDDGELVELIVEEKNKEFSVGSVYSGIVKKILPGQFAFIDIGDSRDTFLYLIDNKEKNIFQYNERKNQNELKIKCGQEIVVQIVKEGTDIKCPVVSSMITFSGRYIVMLFNDSGVNISKKISDETKKSQLFALGKKIVDKYSIDFGVIMRTNCVDVDENVIIDEANSIIERYNEVVKKGNFYKAPSEIYKAESETNRIIRDLLKNDTDEIVVNEISIYNNFFHEYSEKGKGKLVFYDNPVPMFDSFFVEKQIEYALHNKIWLKCGGFIVIDYTEACVVIDVNTGKYSGKNHRQVVLKTNIEAAREITKQIRLRNLSGMIIIDFIDMKFSEDREAVKAIIQNEVKKDRVGVFVVGMTELGLMQLTRKKIRQPIYKVLTCKCPACMGNGFIFNEHFISDKIKNEICSIFSSTIYNRVVVHSNKKVIDSLKGKNDEYKLIEEKFKGKIEFDVILTHKLDYYKLDKFKSR